MKADRVIRQPEVWTKLEGRPQPKRERGKLAGWLMRRWRYIDLIRVFDARPEDAVRDLYPEHRHAEAIKRRSGGA